VRRKQGTFVSFAALIIALLLTGFYGLLNYRRNRFALTLNFLMRLSVILRRKKLTSSLLHEDFNAL